MKIEMIIEVRMVGQKKKEKKKGEKKWRKKIFLGTKWILRSTKIVVEKGLHDGEDAR